ncbi:MAG: glycerophosphoryl diester phosphodiesterase [Chitinophagaceae bacterium]|nr:glycerophosphoryl diester phosphodiesterase [Chitinophagaceae bacterium]
MVKMQVYFLLFFSICAGKIVEGNDSLLLANDAVRIVWKHGPKGWHITTVEGKVRGQWVDAGVPSGEYTLLYSKDKPSETPEETFHTSAGAPWPDTVYKYQINLWKQATSPVAMNTAGEVMFFYPDKAEVVTGAPAGGRRAVRFIQETAWATVIVEWSLDPAYATDVRVRQTLIPRVAGYFSLASPSLLEIDVKDLAWATVPGYFQGSRLQPDFVSAYAYGQGIPERPVIYRERCASTLSPIISTTQGLSLSVIPDPGVGRDPWAKDHYTHQDWQVGISHMNRRTQLCPTMWYPVLGEPLSALSKGQTVRCSFRFCIREGDWYASLHHSINDIYHFKEGLALRHNRKSLTNRVFRMLNYLADTRTALWNVEEYKGLKIGAQSYLGGVVGSQRDAMKNSDYGSMWMIGAITGLDWFRDSILPFARNFKLVQQQTDTGFFRGAAIGQYYLAKRKKFVEEWGEFVEPVSLTYYTMLDLGNVLLFEPGDTVLQQRLRLGAELLLRWQRPDGSWDVAYDRHSHQPLFTDLRDLRPTFYGLLVAYRVLKDKKYLDAAEKGARWLIANSVDQGHFIGVCGDARYASDFATGQTAQCLLDLYDITGVEEYKDAAVRAARIYTVSIYTHPVPVGKNWEIAQAGLSFEHGGIIGSANGAGPILLCSHAGLFIRMFRLTGDSLFADMARAAAIGRDAFVDSATGVASYYWNAMNKGAGPYPHHAWWQIGWITDYLLAEAELRSGGAIAFPRGFVTPKVGPHESCGFAPGVISGAAVNLIVRPGLVSVDNPDVEIVTALATDSRRLYIIALNDRNIAMEAQVRLDITKLSTDKHFKVAGHQTSRPVKLSPYGIVVQAIDVE